MFLANSWRSRLRNRMKALLVVYDNDSHISHFPTSLAYVASIFNKNDVRVVIYNQDIYHYPDEHLTRFLDENDFNFVCVSTVGGYYPYRKLLKISKAINNSEKRNAFKYLLGGYGPSPAAEFFLKKQTPTWCFKAIVKLL